MTSISLNGLSSPRPYPPRAINASGTLVSPFPRAVAAAPPKTYRNKTSTSSARRAQIEARKKFHQNKKRRFEKSPAGLTDENSRGSRSPAGCEQIIQQHHPLTGSYAIDMHLHFGFAVLE